MPRLSKVALLLVVMLALPLVALAQTQEPNALVGTWELNLAKSKFESEPPSKSRTYTYEAVPNGIKYAGKTIGADGKPSLVAWTAYFDGKDYPFTGDPTIDTIAIKRIDRFTSEGVFKKAGKVTGRIRRVVSPDGKVLTTTSEGTDEKGKPYKDVLVFDRR